MGLRFRKSIKIVPGLKINISKSGISATIGKRGSSVNIGDKGTYINLGIPGTGISYREKISSKTNIPEYESLPSSGDYKYTFLMMKINSVGISSTVNLEEAGAIATYFDPTAQDLLLLFSGILEGNTTKILLTNKNIFFASKKVDNIQVNRISLQDIKNIGIKKGIFFSSITLVLADKIIILDMVSKKVSSKLLEYSENLLGHNNVDDMQDDFAAYHKKIETPSNLYSDSDIDAISHIENSKAYEAKPSSSIFFKLLKFVCCCFFSLIALFCILGAMTQGKEWLCFPLAFIIAGSLTAYTVRYKGENSAFKWWLYGVLVPFVSWIDAVMLNSQNRGRAFIKGLAYSLLGFLVFMIVFIQFLQ